MSLTTILSCLSEYLSIPAVVGFERPFIEYLGDVFSLSGYEVEKRDRLLVVKKKGSLSRTIFTAHIDRHGLVVGENGNVEYAAFGVKKMYGDKVEVSTSLLREIGERFLNERVYAYDGRNGEIIVEGKVSGFSYDIHTKSLFFYIKGFENLSPYTPISYFSQVEVREERVSSQLDNAISIAVMYQLIKDGFDGLLLFTTEEEIGRSWRYIVEYLQRKDIRSKEIITIDVTPYMHERVIERGSVTLRNGDALAEFNKDVVERLRELCTMMDIEYDIKSKKGKTELGRVIKHSGGKYSGVTVQLPTLHYHTNHETTSLASLRNYYQLLKRLAYFS